MGRACASHENEQSLTRSNELKLEGADQKAIAKIVKKKKKERGKKGKIVTDSVKAITR